MIRQRLKSDSESPPTPANKLTITIDSGYSLKPNSESIYINGILQSEGAANDYTISGNDITFTFNLSASDSVYVTYLKVTA